MAKPFGIEADRGTLSPGCPEMPEAAKKRAEGSGWWPSVETEVEAKGAAHQGAGAAVFVASVTALFSVLAMFDIRILPGFSPLSLVDAGLFAIVAWRIYRMSRVWALLGLLGYISERAYSMYVHGATATAGWVVGVVILLGFVNGVRGTLAYHRLSASRDRIPIVS